MDEKLFLLVQEFSGDCVRAKPYDLDMVGLDYMKRAYELGKDAGRAETRAARTETNRHCHSDASSNGGESADVSP